MKLVSLDEDQSVANAETVQKVVLCLQVKTAKCPYCSHWIEVADLHKYVKCYQCLRTSQVSGDTGTLVKLHTEHPLS